MAKNTIEHKKLPGSKKGFLIGKYTLWQGGDHLLHIFSRFGIEDYKRFYFNDIQAIIARKTMAGKVQNGILGGLILLFMLPALVFDGGWSILYVIVSAVMFIFLLINLVQGPTCETRLMTAVQTEKLQSLNRLNTAFRVMDGLRPQIQQVQGALTREDLNKIALQPVGRHAFRDSAKANPAPRATRRHENGRAHMILFALMAGNGVLVTGEFFVSHVVPTILGSVASLCIGIFVIIALVRQHNSDLPVGLRTITWTSLGLVGAAFVMGYIIGMVNAFKNPGIAYSQWELVKSISSLSPWDSPLKLGYNILVLGGALFLGIPGLILRQRFVSRANKTATAKSAPVGQTLASRTPEPG